MYKLKYRGNTYYRFKLPKNKQIRSKIGSVDPLIRFYKWLFNRLKKNDKYYLFINLYNKNYTNFDISKIIMNKKDVDKLLRKEVLRWLEKTEAHWPYTIIENKVGFAFLDIGPNEFFNYKPKWAEYGYVYVAENPFL